MKAEVAGPTMILDEEKVRRNIAAMARKARNSGVRFRPHFKTHQSADVGRWFRDCGVEAITVSSVRMARYFADAGWADITVAFPVNVRELEAVDELAGRVRLHLLADADEALDALEARLTGRAGVWVEIDPDYGRTGVAVDDRETVLRLARHVHGSRNLELRGILTHTGQTYGAASVAEIRSIHAKTAVKLGSLRELLKANGLPCEVSVGDTPACAVLQTITGADEIRPGNFVFYDLMQWRLGVCEPGDIAVAAACPVVGVYPERGRIAIYGGAVHLSKESLADETGRRIFGLALPPEEALEAPSGVPLLQRAAPVVNLTQEHGIVQAGEHLLGRTRIGDILHVFPVHSCLTCHLHDHYLTRVGEVLKKGDRPFS